MARITSSQRIAISGTTAVSTTMIRGAPYAIVASADCTVRFGASNVVAAADTAGNFFLAKGVIIEHIPTDASDSFVAVIGTTGSLYVARVEGV